jgi:hypothetical protein
MVERKRLYPKLQTVPRRDDADSEQKAFERALQPRDKVEEMLCQDTAHHNRRAKQFRDWEDDLIQMNKREALSRILDRVPVERRKADYLIANWSGGVPAAKAEVSAILASVGLSDSAIEAEAFLLCLQSFMALDRLQESQFMRRDRTLASLALYGEAKRRRTQDDRRKVMEVQQSKLVSVNAPEADNDE